MPRGVLVDPKAEVEQEYYAVVRYGTTKRPLMLLPDRATPMLTRLARLFKDSDFPGSARLRGVLEFDPKSR